MKNTKLAKAIAAVLASLSVMSTFAGLSASAETGFTAVSTGAGALCSLCSLGSPIDNYIKSLNYGHDAVFAQDLQSQNSTQKAWQMAENGDCFLFNKVKKGASQKSFADFSVMGSDASIIYPGALLRADSGLVTGNPAPIQQLKRASTMLTISGASMKAGCDRSIKVVPDGAGSIQNTLSVIENNFSDDIDFAAQSDVKIEKIESEQDMKMKMNFSQSMWGSLNIDFEAAQQKKSQIAMVDVNQIYYTVSLGSDFVGDSLFADDETLENVKQQISNENPAVVVDSVSYGRRLCACIETDDTSFDLKAAIKASGAGDKVSGGIEGEYHDKLAKCKVTVWVYGGTSSDAGKFMTMSFDEFLKAASETTGYKRGGALPVSYTTRHITDGTRAQTVYTGDVWSTQICETKKATPFNFKVSGIDYRNLKNATVKIYGRKMTGINEHGRYEIGDLELIDEVKLDYNTSTDGKGRIPGNVCRDSVYFLFESTEAKKDSNFSNEGFIHLNQIKGFDDASATIELSLQRNPESNTVCAYARVMKDNKVLGSQTIYSDSRKGNVFVKDIVVVGAGKIGDLEKSMKEYSDKGYKFLGKDLNKDAGGHWIYLGYLPTTDPSEAIRDLAVWKDSSRPATKESSDGRMYTRCHADGDYEFKVRKLGDLNCKAGGEDIMFYYTKEERGDGKAVLANMFLNEVQAGSVSGKDLNAGVHDSEDIYLHITRSN